MQYFIIENGAQAGPFTPEELVNTKLITAETLVWTDGLKDWTPAWQIEEIRAAMETRTNSQQTPPPVPPKPSGTLFWQLSLFAYSFSW